MNGKIIALFVYTHVRSFLPGLFRSSTVVFPPNIIISPLHSCPQPRRGYLHTHTCIHSYTFALVYTDFCVQTLTYTDCYISIHTHVHVCECTCTCTFAHTYVCVHNTYMHRMIHINRHTCIYMYVYTCTCTCTYNNNVFMHCTYYTYAQDLKSSGCYILWFKNQVRCTQSP